MEVPERAEGKNKDMSRQNDRCAIRIIADEDDELLGDLDHIKPKITRRRMGEDRDLCRLRSVRHGLAFEDVVIGQTRGDRRIKIRIII